MKTNVGRLTGETLRLHDLAASDVRLHRDTDFLGVDLAREDQRYIRPVDGMESTTQQWVAIGSELQLYLMKFDTRNRRLILDERLPTTDLTKNRLKLESSIIFTICGRYRLSRRKQLVEGYFDTVPNDDEWSPRYNVEPTQPVATIRQHHENPSANCRYCDGDSSPLARKIRLAQPE